MCDSAKNWFGWVRLGLLSLALLMPVLGTSSALAAEGTGDAAHDAHGGGNNPITWQGDLALFSAISFAIFLLVLTKFAWKPLTTALDARERRIRDDIEGAEQARIKAERMLEEHASRLDDVQNEVKAILAEARRDAEVARQNILTGAQTEAEATKNRAITEIERARDQALKELFDTMSTRVADATEHVLGHGLSDDVQQRLIDEALTHFADRGVVASRGR